MCRTGSFPHIVLFYDSSSTWHIQIIAHRSIVLYLCLCHDDGQMSPPRVVRVFGAVILDSCTDTILKMRRLVSLGNFPYPEGYFSSNHSIYLIIVWSQPTWGGTYPGKYWWYCCRRPPFVSCLIPCASFLFTLLNRTLIWLIQTPVVGFSRFVLPLP